MSDGGNRPSYTAFRGLHRLANGALPDVARVVWQVLKDTPRSNDAVLIFDDETARIVDLEMRGDERDMLAHVDSITRRDAGEVSPTDERMATHPAPRARGRPKLGVVAREVTLLPRHWAWLATQPGGASVALRRLVEEARRTHAADDRMLAARDAAYRFMHAIAGDLPDFEEATRALYRQDEARFNQILSDWPTDVAAFAARLAFPRDPD